MTSRRARRRSHGRPGERRWTVDDAAARPGGRLAGSRSRVARRPPAPARARARRLPISIGILDASGLLGRGGAGFPVARKWAAVAERGDGRAVILANGAEGEPLSSKDKAIMSARPHLVLDGAELAAEAVGADRIVVYVGEGHRTALAAIESAATERMAVARGGRSPVPIELVAAPDTYVAGEELAAVHYLNRGRCPADDRSHHDHSSAGSAGARPWSRTSSRSRRSRSSPVTATAGIASSARARRVAARS